jgi:CheY-like chemotaxis protein
MLVLNGYETIKAQTGQGALDTVQEQNVDLVISDVRMPVVDGFELCRRIKADRRLMNIPVILITGYAAKDDRIKGIEAGAEDFLSKPIDTLEVLARIKMLLKVKSINEKRIGELLVEMKFITETQLQEALLFSKEKNIKVGEALYAMGALDKDQIYWVLGNQLKMSYIELSEDMLDRDLIAQFPAEILEGLLCIPLYETEEEIHVAIGDPTDQKTIDQVKRFRMEKAVQLHLALPEKIRTLLHGGRNAPGKRRGRPGVTSPLPVVSNSSVWDDFLAHLLLMAAGNQCCFYKTPETGLLVFQKEPLWETVREYSLEASSVIYERLHLQFSPGRNGGPCQVFFGSKSSQQKGLFQLQHVHGVDKDIVLIERTPALSAGEVLRSYPESKELADQIRHLTEIHQRLFIGSADPLYMKQCCYLFVTSHRKRVFPPAVFIENEMQYYLQEVLQVVPSHSNPYGFVKGRLPALVFYERGRSDGSEMGGWSWSGLSDRFDTILVSSSFPSSQSMEKELFADGEWKTAGFAPFYLEQNTLAEL